MNININGEKKEFQEKISISKLLKELGLENKPVVVELNMEIVIKEDYNKELSPNDTLEIVTFVGGG
jgi:thiamine biosynthesis protein ThiS